MRRSLFVAVAVMFAVAACKSGFGDIPSSIPLGVVTVAMFDAPSGVHNTSPAAYFVDAVNVSIPNSLTSADTCAQIAYPGLVNSAPLSQINAGDAITFQSTSDTVQLTPTAADVNGYIHYRPPTNDSVRVVPGSTGRVIIPGASNGFDAFNLQFVNADSLAVQPIDATTDSTGDLTINWNPQVGPTASFVLELEFAAGTSSTLNSQIFCQFRDTGSHAVEARLANLWRASNLKRVHAYRFLTTTTHDDTDQLVVVSQYSTDSTHIVNP